MRTLNLFLLFFFLFALNSYSLPKCEGNDFNKWDRCFGTVEQGGAKYVGEYKDGEYHGKGTLTYANGDKYVGEFRDGMQSKGTYTWGEGEFEGDKYVGEFKDGKGHGQGTYTYADGSKDEGIWENGELVE